ncbi:MAG: hypothetical protein JRJ85_07910, partial [Deltaproteobacteria bacterium]|nr:hypothetical protein [Deltaproteobacteria bacterium]
GLEKQALILSANKNGPYKKFEDILEAKKPVRMALPGKMSTMHVMMAFAQDVWDFKINFIPGYKGAAGQFKATEGGETDMNCGSEVSSAPRIKGGTVHPLVYLTAEKQDFFPDIPAILETPAKNQAAKERFISAIWIYRYSRTLGMPPGVPQDRVEFVRAALKDTLSDPALIAEGKKNGVPFIFTPPGEYKIQKKKLFGGMSAEDKAHLKELLK